MEEFQDIIIYILDNKWSSEKSESYQQKWKNFRYLFGLVVEHRKSGEELKFIKFMNNNFATVLDFNLLLSPYLDISKDRKINITLTNGGVAINYLNRDKGSNRWFVWNDGEGKQKFFEEFEGSNNIQKSKEIINWLGTWFQKAYKDIAKNNTSNYSFGSLRYI